MIRITSGGVVIDVADEIDRDRLNAGWNTVVSGEGITVEVHREPVEAAVADYVAAKAVAEQRIDVVRAELETTRGELAVVEAELAEAGDDVKGGEVRG